MDQRRVALTVSLPPRLARKFEKMAKAESKNKSQLFREMIQTYEQHRLEEEFFELQRYGIRQARKKGVLTEADIDALVFKGRRS
jgi:metal-responsive CopG/Arc/MetJ family transcriptional regulator